MKRMKITLISIIAVLFFLQCCKEKDKEPEPEDNFDESGMLTNLSENLIKPSYEELNTEVEALKTAISQFTTTPNIDNLSSARNTWKSAVLSWQKSSVFQIGPASDIALRDNVNLFPIDTTLINDNIRNGNYDLDIISNYTTKGFQAIDYLLFGIGNTENDILEMYTTDTYSANRLNYLNDITEDLSSKISSINNNWETYASEFKSNTGTDAGSSIGLLTNELNLYFERFVRDGKVGIPAGARTFSQTPLPEKSEAYYYNQNSTSLFLESINSVKKLYIGEGLDGTNGLGYDDYLNHLDAQTTSGSLDQAILDQFNVVENKSSNLGNSIAEEVVNNQSEMLEIFEDMQLLNNLLKVEMTNSLEVQITYSDTDGD